jgi:hypothetical protein
MQVLKKLPAGAYPTQNYKYWITQVHFTLFVTFNQYSLVGQFFAIILSHFFEEHL